MKKVWIILTVLSPFSVDLYGQKAAVWSGGTPGRPCDWYCPSNWRENRVPNEFSYVFIPDVSTKTFSYPVIDKGVIEIAGLQCDAPAGITLLHGARIIVDNEPVRQNENAVSQNLVSMKDP